MTTAMKVLALIILISGYILAIEGSASLCWSCNSQESDALCRQNGQLQMCSSGDAGGCQTVVRGHGGGRMTITKGCKSQSICTSEVTQYASQCRDRTASGSVCYYCCTTDFCNNVLTGECISDCNDIPDGHYQSCLGCNVYASCGGGIFYDNRQCSASILFWDDSRKNCVYDSTTCSGDGGSSDFSCWSCSNAATDAECHSSGSTQTCNSGDYGGCQTEVRSYDNRMTINKRCKAESVCLSEEQQFASQCTGHDVPQSICYYCCTTADCNYNLPAVTVDPSDPPSSTTEETVATGPASVCWACTNANNEAMCVSSGWEQTCSQGDFGGCQTEVRVYQHYKTITKRCKSESVCLAEEQQYASQCTGYDDVGSICYHCCTTDMCNRNLPVIVNPSESPSSTTEETVATGPTSVCWACTNANDEAMCVSSGWEQTCSQGDFGGCQTEVRVYQHYKTITKRCKSESVCLAEEQQYASQCTGYDDVGSICYHCCTTDMCNRNLPGIVNPSESPSSTTEETVATGPASVCWACTNANDEAMCVSSGWEQTCSQGDFGGCQTEVRVYQHYKTITKRCKSESVCLAEEQQYASQCTGYDNVGAICYDCCTTDMCNRNLPDDCADSPCTNGACQDGIDSFTCDCYMTDYDGELCDQKIDDCEESPCSNGVCVDGVRSFTCDCSGIDYEGELCENKIDNCADSPCTNGACVDGLRSFTCDCSGTDYDGSLCENQIDDCADSPCTNGACVDGVRTFTCNCLETDYEGSLCENQIDNCADSPCTNGACVDGLRSFTCDCSGTDYDGSLCENQIDNCADSPCTNGACVDGLRSFTCDCSGTDYDGSLCENQIDDCADSPCTNGACVDGVRTFTCNCLETDYEGSLCENQIDNCADSPCTNGACVDGLRSFTCDCSGTDYDGSLCENQIDNCADSPCTNGACVDGLRSFTCDCSGTDYDGSLCENQIDDCADSPCTNGACVDGVRTFTCNCLETDYEGSLCENRIDDCMDSPCTNGLCVDGMRSFTCDCSNSDYNGPTCENKIDDCADGPCTNGICEDGVRSYTCDCSETDYDGPQCQNKIDDCAASPCTNGVCEDDVRTFSCDCSGTDFEGTLCENQIDDCENLPCNAGVCTDGIRSYTCDCTDTGCVGINCQECQEECIPTYAYLQDGPTCKADSGTYCYVADTVCAVDSRGECVYNTLTSDNSTLQECVGFNMPVCEISMTVDGVEGYYTSRCQEAVDCVNINSLTCPDGNLDCTRCILPYDPCLVDINEMPECYDAALHDYVQLHPVDTSAPEIQEPDTGENYWTSWTLVGDCDCLANLKKYERECVTPSGAGRCRGRSYQLEPCNFLECACAARDFQCWYCEDAESMEDCEQNGCWQTCDNQGEIMCLTTTENYTHPSNPHLAISRGCSTPDICIDHRFEYLNFNVQMEDIIANAEDTSELSEEVFMVKSGVCEPGDLAIPGGYTCGSEVDVCMWTILDNSAQTVTANGSYLLVFALYKLMIN